MVTTPAAELPEKVREASRGFRRGPARTA
jgi:hypothetical protein